MRTALSHLRSSALNGGSILLGGPGAKERFQPPMNADGARARPLPRKACQVGFAIVYQRVDAEAEWEGVRAAKISGDGIIERRARLNGRARLNEGYGWKLSTGISRMGLSQVKHWSRWRTNGHGAIFRRCTARITVVFSIFNRRETHQRTWLGTGWSIFPEFDVDVPMPKGTPIPPRITIIPATPPAENATEETAYE
jgi:hypothetical protein